MERREFTQSSSLCGLSEIPQHAVSSSCQAFESRRGERDNENGEFGARNEQHKGDVR